MPLPHPFNVPLQFGSDHQIRVYRHMEEVKAAREAISEFPIEAVKEALKVMGAVEEVTHNVFVE